MCKKDIGNKVIIVGTFTETHLDRKFEDHRGSNTTV